MRFFLVASLLFAATTARADAPKAPVAKPAPISKTTPTLSTPDAKQMHTDDCAKARSKNKMCVLDMGKGDELTGNAPIGEGVGVGVIETGHNNSLLHIRRDFIVEILKSAEDL